MDKLSVSDKGTPFDHTKVPLVSVCIPTYNRSSKLERAIKSVQNSDYHNLEIIISDNASSDDTQSVSVRLTNGDKRIRYFRQAGNIGPVGNFEFSRARAKGKYFMWLADDDYLDLNYISRCVEALEADSSLALAAGLGAYHRNDGSFAYMGNIVQEKSSLPLLRVVKYLWFVWDNSIFYGLYKREFINDCKFPSFIAGDWAWVANVLLNGKSTVITDVHIHREFEGSSASTIDNMVSVLRSPEWHGKFPWIAISSSISSHMAQSASPNRGIKRVYVYLIVFFVTFFRIKNMKLMIANIPFVVKAHRRLFPKERKCEK